jgi:hypothetical protein
VAAETSKKWHNGVKIPFEPVEGGISEEVVEDWKALKQEIGVECMVIDKIVASSDKTTTTASTSRLPKEQKARHSVRFYNIYNTYVYGDSNVFDHCCVPGTRRTTACQYNISFSWRKKGAEDIVV